MAPKGNSTDITSIPNGNGTLAKATPFHIMLQAMALDATADDGTFAGDDLNGILTADTESEIWDADERGPLNFQHLADCELSIIDVQVKFSRGGRDDITTPFVVTVDGDGGRPVTKKMYLLVTAVRLSDAGEKPTLRLPEIGEVFQANTSARFIVAKIWAFYTKGYISSSSGKTLQCVVKEIDLGDNQAVLKLRPMPRRTVTSGTE